MPFTFKYFPWLTRLLHGKPAKVITVGRAVGKSTAVASGPHWLPPRVSVKETNDERR